MGFAVAGAIGGALISSNAAGNAADAQAGAAGAASQLQYDEYQQTRKDQAPWREAGSQALTQLQNQLPDMTRNFTSADFQQDPGYQFQLQQGQSAIQRSAAARGLMSSTGTMKSLNDYSQGVANQDYQQARNNFVQNQQQRYNSLASIAGVGQQAVNQTSAAGMNYANNAGQNMIGAGNAAAAGMVGQANAYSGAIGQGMNTWMNNNAMDRMFPQNNGGGGGGGGGGGIVSGSSGGGGSVFGNNYSL